MSINPYVILGVNKDATQSEIQEAYEQKRDFYKQHIFDEGDAGADAARNLEMLENAYKQAMESTHENATVSDEDVFGGVKQAITEKNTVKAQQELDGISFRNAEWHYYQSIVFYEKNWLNDSKKQLEIALQMDPNNEKYTRALNNLKKKIDGSRPYDKEGSQGIYGANSNPATQRTYDQRGADVTDGICATCQALWCADCCCECMGGDLIRCC